MYSSSCNIGPEVDELDAGVLGTDAVDTAKALHNAHRVPVDIVVDDAVAVLQVLAFGNTVGRDEHVDVLALEPRIRDVAVLRYRTEAGDDFVHVVANALDRAAGALRAASDLSGLEPIATLHIGSDVLVEVVRRVSERRKDQQLLVARIYGVLDLVRDNAPELSQFRVMLGIDGGDKLADVLERLEVLEHIALPANPVHILEREPALGADRKVGVPLLILKGLDTLDRRAGRAGAIVLNNL